MKGFGADITNCGNSFEMIGLEDFARRMSVCPNSVRNWIKDGKLSEGIHYFHHSRIYRFPWGPDFVKQLMLSLAPAPSPSRPQLQSRSGNRGRLHYRA